MHGFEFLDELVILCLAAVIVILVFKRFQLPPVVGLIVTGILAGPTGFGYITESHVITIIAELGVTMLLFSTGLEFSMDDLVRLKRIVLIGGPLQIILGSLLLGTVVVSGATLIGESLDWGAGIAIGMMFALSSTAICINVLKQRDELMTSHGKAILGILIFQDIAVVPMIIVISLLTPGNEITVGTILLRLGGVAVAIVTLTWLLRLVFPRLVRFVARADVPEVLVLGALTLCFGAAAITDLLGMSLALGAFIAGVAISESEDSRFIDRVMMPFRDAFTSIFFISIGLLLNVNLLDLPLNIVGAFVVILINAVVATGILHMLGIPWRIAVIAGIALAEVGEFSFVLANTALQGTLISNEAYQRILVVIIITMIVAPLLFAVAPRVSRLVSAKPPAA
ncbi:MAG: cation:proton antiporter [Bradyrhizobiaceae bacterium]|nr:cation:proton antiporter [Bradyrhizobiaceae bacterium]